MPYTPDIHHRHSIRLKDYDYSRPGAYFVTICAWQRECIFGDVANGEMVLNDVGRVVQAEWHRLPGRFPQIELDMFVIMPNHFHGIINIVGAQFIALGMCGRDVKGAMNRAPTVGEMVRTFKARCTHAINILRNNAGCPVWQRNYYERVIRNEKELSLAREYIVNNPMKWDRDRENPVNVV
ncbi:MAG: transposase [Desulfuromonadales bacterium]|nr:MAG: transposase [Desulfuromonadales bacterium]